MYLIIFDDPLQIQALERVERPRLLAVINVLLVTVNWAAVVVVFQPELLDDPVVHDRVLGLQVRPDCLRRTISNLPHFPLLTMNLIC